MPIPTWSVGEVLSASDVNSWFVPLAAIKASDTGRSSTTVLAADPDLVLAAAASAQYDVRAVIRYKGGTNGSSDAQFQINVPSGASGFWIAQRQNISGGGGVIGFADQSFGAALNAGTSGTGNTQQIIISASVTTSASTGNITVLWAQNTSSGTATTVMTGSYIVAQRIG
jgi:hypothetical protein